MSHSIQFELDQNRKRLNYYAGLKTKSPEKGASLDKWISIYDERIVKLEKQLQKIQKQQQTKTA